MDSLGRWRGDPVQAPLLLALLLLGLLQGVLGLTASPAASQTPTRRPESRHQAAPVSKDQREKSDAAQAAKAPPPPPSSPSEVDEEATPPPYNLPAASRARVRECSDKWQSMKMEGKVGDGIWRDFATQCLAAKDGPFDKH